MIAPTHRYIIVYPNLYVEVCLLYILFYTENKRM